MYCSIGKEDLREIVIEMFIEFQYTLVKTMEHLIYTKGVDYHENGFKSMNYMPRFFTLILWQAGQITTVTKDFWEQLIFLFAIWTPETQKN